MFTSAPLFLPVITRHSVGNDLPYWSVPHLVTEKSLLEIPVLINASSNP